MTAEDRDAKLSESAESLAAACVGLHACDLGPPVVERVGEYHNEPPSSREECARCCSEARILAALRQTEEEARQEASIRIAGLYSQAMGHASRKPTGCAMHPCWVCAEVDAAHAAGERAGREAEREAAALLVEDGHGNIGRMLAAAIRARGFE